MMKKKEKIVIAGILFLVVLEILKYGIAMKVIVGGFLVYQVYKFLKRGCEITASTEKEDFSFKMNERSSFMLKLTCDENFNYKL